MAARERRTFRQAPTAWPIGCSPQGSLYYALHAHGQPATGRWVDPSFDGPVVTGLAALARTADEALGLMTELQKGETT